MPDEAIYARRAIELWRDGSLPLLHGQGVGYGVLYPLVAGFPLSVGDIAQGYGSLKLLQALVMSLAAAPVFFYGRRIVPAPYALFAAALTVASPILLYSGLVMTEVVYYPLAALITFSIARAVETGSRRHQLVALALIAAGVATRTQAVVFLPVFAGAAALDSVLRRDTARLRLFLPVGVVTAAGIAVAALAPGVFGVYAGTLSGSYPVGLSLRLTYYHLAYAAVMVAVVPVAATVLVLVDAVRRRVDAPARALVSVTTCSVLLVVVQVGLFSARYSPHLLGRDLAALPAPLFLLFAFWLARQGDRSYLTRASVLVGVLAAVALAPWNTLVTANAVPDTFGIALLYRIHESPSDVVTVGSAALLLIALFAPRPLAAVTGALVLSALVTSTVLASNQIVALAKRDQATLVGSPRNWIDLASSTPVTYVHAESTDWPVVWQQQFWNRRLDAVLSLGSSLVPGPIAQTRLASVPADGALPLRSRDVVANARMTFFGTPLATHSRGADDYALTLWQLTGQPRLSTITSGVSPNGDIENAGHITAYDCGGGDLRLTLLPKATPAVEVDLDGRRVLRRRIAGLPSWRTVIHVPPSAAVKACRFTIRGGPLLGTTVLLFERPS